MTAAVVVWCSVPTAELGQKLARTLVEERWAACVHMLPAGRSIYVWQGRLEDETEHLLMIKTRAALFEGLCQRLRALHPYQVPEILATPVSAGLPQYLAWLQAETAEASSDAGERQD
ncbi:MAG: divalent-cation tolerance protein CutA [Magnetococcus sp. WYHC-3]